MSQNDMVIANQTAALARADINSALQALASNSLGTSAPSTTYAGQWWYDSSAAILKLRNSANSAWIDVGIFSSGSFVPSPGIASQAQAEAGTDNTTFMTMGQSNGSRGGIDCVPNRISDCGVFDQFDRRFEHCFEQWHRAQFVIFQDRVQLRYRQR